MRRSLGLSFFILLISFIFPFCTFASFAHTSEYDDITKAIQQKKTRWFADHTSVAVGNYELPFSASGDSAILMIKSSDAVMTKSLSLMQDKFS
ncbi:MAG: hypothetical protein CSYNP_03348 [Syntrophus sp. SKADARSKE-3]|nr:hypothetical protein [Syntrophus sp. SKADARSKE-3]